MTTTEPSKSLELVTAAGVLEPFRNNPWDGIDDGLIGWEHVGMSIPLLKSDMRPDGGWTDEVTEDQVDELDVVILAAAPSRAYWETSFADSGGGDNPPDCRSNDMIVPDSGSPKVQAKTCAECPWSEWRGDEPPACAARINALVYDTNLKRLARVGFGGTAFKHMRRYISSLRVSVPPKPPLAVVTHIELEKVEGEGRKWLEPRFKAVAEVPAGEAGPLIALRDKAIESWRSKVAEDLATGAAHDGTAVTNSPDAGDPFDEPDTYTPDDPARPFDIPLDDEPADAELVPDDPPAAPSKGQLVQAKIDELGVDRHDLADLLDIDGNSELGDSQLELVRQVLEQLEAEQLDIAYENGAPRFVNAGGQPVTVTGGDGGLIIKPAGQTEQLPGVDWAAEAQRTGKTAAAVLRRARTLASKAGVDANTITDIKTIPTHLDEALRAWLEEGAKAS